MTAHTRLPIVLLPGMTGTADLLLDVKQHLGSHHSVHVIDYPLIGPQDYDILTDHVIRHLPAGPFVILGESFSGPIAIEIAVREPRRTAGLVLAATFARHPLPAALGPLAYWTDIGMFPQFLIEAMMLGPYGSPTLRSEFARVLSTIPSATLRARTHETLSVDKRALLAKIDCPALCLTGRHDRLIPVDRAEEIIEGINHCAHIALEAPHMFLETHPRESAAAISAFCAQLDAVPDATVAQRIAVH